MSKCLFANAWALSTIGGTHWMVTRGNTDTVMAWTALAVSVHAVGAAAFVAPESA